MERIKISFRDEKARAEAWRMLRGETGLNMGYLLELIDVEPARYLPKVHPETLRAYMSNFVYCQDCGGVLAVEPCVTCLGVGIDGCSECGGDGGTAYCPRCDVDDEGEDDTAVWW